MESNKKKKPNLGKITALVILIAALAIYFYMNKSEAQTASEAVFGETDAVFDFNYDDKTDIYSYGSRGFFLTTKDGMNYYTSDKQVKWTEIYPVSIKEPLMSGKGQYVGICDANGTAFYMFSGEGLLYSKNYENKILSFSVSAGGYASVIAKSGDEYVIQAISPKGEVINSYYCRNENVFPVASCISGDGRMLAISVVDINSTIIASKLMLLYNNADEKQSWMNGIFYQDSSRENELIGRLEFLDSNELLFLSDASLTCLTTEFGTGGSPKVKWIIPFSNEIDAMAVSSGKVIAIAYGKPVPGEDSKPSGTVSIYNLESHMIGEYEFSGRVAYLTASGDYISAGSGKKHAAFNSKGKCVWEYNAPSDVKKVSMLENQNTFLVLDNLRAQVIKKR